MTDSINRDQQDSRSRLGEQPGATDDDLIIATVFKRSLLVFVVLALIAALIWLLIGGSEQQQYSVVEQDLISPQPTLVKSERMPPSVVFTDITQASGIRHSHRNGAYGERLLPETMGGGVAVLDYNNDQLADLLFINGQPWPWSEQAALDSDASSLILYQGDGAGNFTDVTVQVSLQASLYGMGVAVGDYNQDGFVDIFVTAVGANRLYRNLAGEGFEEVSEYAGVRGGDDAWSTGAAFVDFDRDGDLDLVALNYVRWSREIDLQANYQLTGIGRAYGPPEQFAGTDSYFYRNDGDGRFTDISAEAGIHVKNPSTGEPLGKGLAVLPTDVDNDGWVDLVVANDMVRNFLFRNKDGVGFEEIGVQSGVAFDNTGSATGAMGIDGMALTDSGEYAIAIGNFGNEMTSLYVRPAESSLFTDQAIITGVGPASRRAVTFGLFFFDYDLDGRADLLQANGHIEDEINVVEPGQHYRQPPQLFWNCGTECPRQFIPVKLTADNDLSQPLVGRGAAYTDIDSDGDLDVIMTQIAAPPVLLRNDQLSGNNWIQFQVLDSNGAPAIGASVEINAGAARQFRRVESTRSYLSQVDPSVNFGIGRSSSVDVVNIAWPDGTRRSIQQPAINRIHIIRPD